MISLDEVLGADGRTSPLRATQAHVTDRENYVDCVEHADVVFSGAIRRADRLRVPRRAAKVSVPKTSEVF